MEVYFFFTLCHRGYTIYGREIHFVFIDRNRGVYSIEFVSIDERPPRIRPPPRLLQPAPSSIQHSSFEVHDSSTHPAEVSKLSQPISLSAITANETSSVTVSIRRPSVTKFGLKPKAESTIKNKLLIQSKPTPEPESESKQQLNSREIDYLYFDNGSLTLSQFRLVHFISFSTSFILLFVNL